jgi:hypothetical protein
MSLLKLEKLDFYLSPETHSYMKCELALESNGVDVNSLLEDYYNHNESIQILKDFYDKNGFLYSTFEECNEKASFEIMNAGYITPHNDADLLNESMKSYMEIQVLIPYKIDHHGYDIYVYDIDTKTLFKESCEFNKPILLDYRKIHFGLPSHLNKNEKELLNKVIKMLNETKTIDNYHLTTNERVFGLISSFAKKYSDVRWNHSSDTTFLSGRVFAPNQIFDKKEKLKVVNNQEKIKTNKLKI